MKTFYRYYRPLMPGVSPNRQYMSNVPSVTVRVDVKDDDTMDVTWALLSKKDRFEKAVGRKLVNERYETNGYQTFTTDYRGDTPMLIQIISALENIVTDEEMNDVLSDDEYVSYTKVLDCLKAVHTINFGFDSSKVYTHSKVDVNGRKERAYNPVVQNNYIVHEIFQKIMESPKRFFGNLKGVTQ